MRAILSRRRQVPGDCGHRLKCQQAASTPPQPPTGLVTISRHVLTYPTNGIAGSDLHPATQRVPAIHRAEQKPRAGTKSRNERRRGHALRDLRVHISVVKTRSTYFFPSEALISATDVSRSGLRLCTDMMRSTSSFRRSMLSANTIVPVTGGLGTGASAGGRLNMSA